MNSNLDQVKKVYSFWGKFPWAYALQDYITFMGRPRFIRGAAVKELKLKPGDKVLEVGCGSGRNFFYLAQAVGPDGQIVGFDYSQEMLDAAKKLCDRNGWQNVKLIQGDAAEMAVGETDFDGVLSVLGISAIPGWEQALKKCRDALRPGGRLVVCDARPFLGPMKFLNFLIKFIYTRFAAWDPSKDIPLKIKEIFGNIEIQEFNLGTFFIASAVK